MPASKFSGQPISIKVTKPKFRTNLIAMMLISNRPPAPDPAAKFAREVEDFATASWSMA